MVWRWGLCMISWLKMWCETKKKNFYIYAYYCSNCAWFFSYWAFFFNCQPLLSWMFVAIGNRSDVFHPKASFPLKKCSLKMHWRVTVLRFILLTQIDVAFAYSTGLHIIIKHTIYAHVWTEFILFHDKKKKVCGCHRASCGSFLLGWHAGVVLCLRASWDIMWAYQVATRVSGGVWVTEGLLILELYHFLPLSSDSGRHGVRQAVRDYTVETEYLSYVDKKKWSL